MSVYITARYGGGSTLYTRNGDFLYEGEGCGGRIMATIDGKWIYFGLGRVNLAGMVDGNKVYAGNGGGHPMYTVDGNTIYDSLGGGGNILTASENDTMALAAAGFLRFGDESLRGHEPRVRPESFHNDFESSRDRWFAWDSDRDEVMRMAGFGSGGSGGSGGGRSGGPAGSSFGSDYGGSGLGIGSVPSPGWEPPYVEPCERYYQTARGGLNRSGSTATLLTPDEVIRKFRYANSWESDDWWEYYLGLDPETMNHDQRIYLILKAKRDNIRLEHEKFLRNEEKRKQLLRERKSPDAYQFGSLVGAILTFLVFLFFFGLTPYFFPSLLVCVVIFFIMFSMNLRNNR